MGSQENCKCTKLICKEYGDPFKVLQLEVEPVPEPNGNEVLIQMLMAPVNPVDVNIIQGVYSLKLPLPGTPGYEGVGRIVKIGPQVKNLKVGDHVIPIRFIGVFRTYLVSPEDILLKVPNELGLPDASMLAVNPPTVYRMLKDFANLNPGDTVIQNGANSACGVLAIQMCKIWGYISVNVIRNRPDVDDLKTYLKKLGANYVYTEEEMVDVDIFKTGTAPRPTLALNCVGGKSASLLMKQLDIGGVMVTYGGMSMQPITVSTSALVFRDLSLEGFNIGKWVFNSDNHEDMVRMFNEIIGWYVNKKMEVPPYVLVKFENYKDCLQSVITKTGMVGKKYILDFSGIHSKI